MRAPRDPYVTFINAKGVAGLWIAAAVLPIFLVPRTGADFGAGNIIALAILVGMVGLVRWDLKRLSDGRRLPLSDKVVYVVVPLAIFFSVLTLVLGEIYA